MPLMSDVGAILTPRPKVWSAFHKAKASRSVFLSMLNEGRIVSHSRLGSTAVHLLGSHVQSSCNWITCRLPGAEMAPAILAQGIKHTDDCEYSRKAMHAYTKIMPMMRNAPSEHWGTRKGLILPLFTDWPDHIAPRGIASQVKTGRGHSPPSARARELLPPPGREAKKLSFYESKTFNRVMSPSA